MKGHSIHSMECASLKKLPSISFQGETAPLRCIMRAMNLAYLENLAIQDEKKKLNERSSKLKVYRPKPGSAWSDIDGLMTHADKLPQEFKTQILQVSRLYIHIYIYSYLFIHS